jgi:hypothetical protein
VCDHSQDQGTIETVVVTLIVSLTQITLILMEL